MISRRKHRYRTGLIAVVAVVVLAVLAAGTFLVKRYAPSKEWMDGYKYFEVDSNTDKTFVIIDNKSYSDNVEIEVELIYKVALNEGLRFAIREGGRTVGSGQITTILDDIK